MSTKAQQGNATSGAVSADQDLVEFRDLDMDALIRHLGEIVAGAWQIDETGQDTETSPRESERSRRTAPPDAVKSPRTGDSRQRREVVDPPLARSYSTPVPPAPGSG